MEDSTTTRGDKPCDPQMAGMLDSWAEYEQRQLYLQSSLHFASENYRWKLDKNLEAINSPNPWVAVSEASVTLTRSTAPRRHTMLDEFGYCFRGDLQWQAQCLIALNHFGSYEMLAVLRLREGEQQWKDLMRYLERLSPVKRELSKTIAASWLALRLAWQRRRRHAARCIA